MNKVDYELLERKGFIKNHKIDEDVLMVAVSKDALEFYTALYMKYQSRDILLPQIVRICELVENGQFTYFHLRTQRLYENVTQKELDDLYIASLDASVLEQYSAGFCSLLLMIDAAFARGDGELLLSFARGLRGYGK